MPRVRKPPPCSPPEYSLFRLRRQRSRFGCCCMQGQQSGFLAPLLHCAVSPLRGRGCMARVPRVPFGHPGLLLCGPFGAVRDSGKHCRYAASYMVCASRSTSSRKRGLREFANDMSTVRPSRLERSASIVPNRMSPTRSPGKNSTNTPTPLPGRKSSLSTPKERVA